MVDLITEKFGSVSPYINPAGSLQSFKSGYEAEGQNKDDEGLNLKKKLIPFGLISSGALLVYLGVKKPGAVKFLNNMVKERLGRISQNVPEFTEEVKKAVPGAFEKAETYIEKYKEDKWIKPAEVLNPLKKSKSAEEIISAQDAGFENLLQFLNKKRVPGATDYDNFLVFLQKIRCNLGKELELRRFDRDRANGDLIVLPKFKDGKRQDLLDTLSAKIDKEVKSVSEQMKNIEDAIFDKSFREKAVKMTKVITEERTLISETRNLLVDIAFPKIRSALNLPETFIPLYRQIPDLDNFSKLSLQDLKPKAFPEGTEQIFKGTNIADILKSKDFSTLDDNYFTGLFHSMSEFPNVSTLGIIRDRLRLKAVLSQHSEKNEEALYNNMISKIEFLQNKLNEIGHKELFSKLSQDFEKLSSEQKHAKLYYISRDARKLGYISIDDMHRKLSKSYPEYDNIIGMRVLIPEIKNNPDYYFY